MKKNNNTVEGPDGLVYTARLPLSSATLNWLANLIRGHLKEIGSPWRALPPGRIAGIVLAVLRCDQRPGDTAATASTAPPSPGGSGKSSVCWPPAPRLDRALKKIARTGGGVVLLDGSLIRTGRRTGAASRKNYSGKQKCHGLLGIALTDDKGPLIWVSAARPGRTSEITACRHDKLTTHLRAAGLGAIADLGFVGLDDSGPDADPAVITGYKAARNRPLTRGQKLSNTALAAVRAPVEHGFAHLKNWRVLGKVRTDPKRATALVRPCWSEPRSFPLTDDLHRGHPPVTSPSTPEPAHTRPTTCSFTMHTAHWCAHRHPLVQVRPGARVTPCPGLLPGRAPPCPPLLPGPFLLAAAPSGRRSDRGQGGA